MQDRRYVQSYVIRLINTRVRVERAGSVEPVR